MLGGAQQGTRNCAHCAQSKPRSKQNRQDLGITASRQKGNSVESLESPGSQHVFVCLASSTTQLHTAANYKCALSQNVALLVGREEVDSREDAIGKVPKLDVQVNGRDGTV